jgi:hypothetical protein
MMLDLVLLASTWLVLLLAEFDTVSTVFVNIFRIYVLRYNGWLVDSTVADSYKTLLH